VRVACLALEADAVLVVALGPGIRAVRSALDPVISNCR